jgi:esterase/lipase superfamily enzyme
MLQFSNSLFAKSLMPRHCISSLGLAAFLVVASSLSGCSEAPKIPGEPKSTGSQADGPTAGAPAPVEQSPQDEEKQASGGEQAPGSEPAPATEAAKPKKAEPPPVASAEPAPPPAAPAQSDDAAARQAEARRNLAEAYRRQSQQQVDQDRESQNNRYGGSAGSKQPADGSSSSDITGAQPPPPPAPAPQASGQPKDGGAPPDDSAASRDRGLGAPAKPPLPLANKPQTFDVVPVFYGTDRTVEPDPKRLQYGTERGHKLQLGRALVTVPTAHKVPNIERPWVVELPYFKYKIYEEKEDPDQHFTMQEIAALSKDQLLVYVKERLAKSAKFKDHAFVFVHGFNTSFDAAIYRTAQIAYDLKFDGAPFVYSWPSGGKVASYTYDRGSAEQAEPQLTEFLDMVIKESGAKSISLIAHSMGNELLLRVLERMKPSVPKGVVISQVILAAPDVDRDKFTNIAREITNFAKGVTLYAASNDKALGYSARFWGGVPRAGDVPSTGPLIIPGVDTIDVTAVSTDSLGLNHSGYAESQTLLTDIGLLLQTGLRPPDKRVPGLLKIDGTGGAFWRYPVQVVPH